MAERLVDVPAARGGPRHGQRRFEQALVADAEGAAERLDLALVQLQHLLELEEVRLRHRASFRKVPA